MLYGRDCRLTNALKGKVSFMNHAHDPSNVPHTSHGKKHLVAFYDCFLCLIQAATQFVTHAHARLLN